MRHELPWWEPAMTGRELEAVAEAVEANYLNEGDITARFEKRIAALTGSRFAVACTSGTAALFLALAALDLGPGDEVVVPDITFIATANAVRLAGARPVLADVDQQTLCLDPGALERAITSRTKAVIPVHVSGRAGTLPQVLEVARAKGLAVVEDAAEALTSSWQGRCLGTLGQAGCLSFSPNKSITTGQGGMVLTDDPDMALRLRQLKDQGRPVQGTGGDDHHPVLGYNFKLTNLQAAVGLAQLEELESRTQRQRRIYSIYAERLADLPGLRLPGFDLEGGEIPQWTDAVVEERERLDEYLSRHGVQCRRFWLPLHTQPPYRGPDQDFPVASRLSPRALWLPSAFTLSDEDVHRVCDLIKECVGS